MQVLCRHNIRPLGQGGVLNSGGGAQDINLRELTKEYGPI